MNNITVTTTTIDLDKEQAEQEKRIEAYRLALERMNEKKAAKGMKNDE